MLHLHLKKDMAGNEAKMQCSLQEKEGKDIRIGDY